MEYLNKRIIKQLTGVNLLEIRGIRWDELYESEVNEIVCEIKRWFRERDEYDSHRLTIYKNHNLIPVGTQNYVVRCG